MSDEEVLANLDWDTPNIDDVVDVTMLPNYELSCLERDTRQALLDRGEMMKPMLECSEEGRQLHTRWIACQVEMKKRLRP